VAQLRASEVLEGSTAYRVCAVALTLTQKNFTIWGADDRKLTTEWSDRTEHTVNFQGQPPGSWLLANGRQNTVLLVYARRRVGRSCIDTEIELVTIPDPRNVPRGPDGRRLETEHPVDLQYCHCQVCHITFTD
jgi:hypothetical protein